MSELKIGIYSSEDSLGGLYNVLSTFPKGLYKAFKDKFYDVEYMYRYYEQNILPDMTIAFNWGCHEHWKSYLDRNIPHIMWSVDSLFMRYEALKVSMQYPHFIFACVAYSDMEAVKHFFPDLPFMYLPHAVDTDLWTPDNTKKEHDIVFFSSLRDYKQKIAEYKEIWEPDKFEQFMSIYEYSLQNPDKSFWDVYSYFAPIFYFNTGDGEFYHELFNALCYTVTYTRRANLISRLSDYNVKVWGNAVWERYISGNVKYMGAADVTDSLKIIPKSKIVLHLQPMQIIHGLHERIVNTSSANSFILTDNNHVIKQSFGDTLGYYDSYSFDNLDETVSCYLNNSEKREEKAAQARQITTTNHTWRNRVNELFNAISS